MCAALRICPRYRTVPYRWKSSFVHRRFADLESRRRPPDLREQLPLRYPQIRSPKIRTPASSADAPADASVSWYCAVSKGDLTWTDAIFLLPPNNSGPG